MAEIRAECNARTADAAAPAPSDAHSCCTNSPDRPHRDRTPVTHPVRSSTPAPRSFLDLHTQKTFPWTWETPEGAFPHAQTLALPSPDAVPGCTLCDIRDSFFPGPGRRNILPEPPRTGHRVRRNFAWIFSASLPAFFPILCTQGASPFTFA